MNAAARSKPDWTTQYDQLAGGVGLVDLEGRTQIEVAGADRASFLHNLCTNEVRKLAVGAGCEAFLTNVQGKTLAHVFIFATGQSLIIDTVAGQGETILKHLDHYLISERVTLADRSFEWSEQLLAGPGADPLIKRLCAAGFPSTVLSHAAVDVAGQRAWLRRVDVTTSPGCFVSVRREDVQAIRAALVAAGAVECPAAAFEAARIERGFPLFGQDITDKNLPQEVGRDASAISFVKGCYLGQETVARIDALGHVNKLLVGLRFAGEIVPQAGSELRAKDQVIGQVTSASYSPRCASPLALGYVRRGSHTVGSRLASAFGEAEVTELPLG
jgi:folate-binding protein YgfZ